MILGGRNITRVTAPSNERREAEVWLSDVYDDGLECFAFEVLDDRKEPVAEFLFADQDAASHARNAMLGALGPSVGVAPALRTRKQRSG
jgi:hypothetical protein